MFGNLLKKVGSFLSKVQDIEEVPQYLRMKKAEWGFNKKGQIALLNYWCPKSMMDCGWYGLRCGKCSHR